MATIFHRRPVRDGCPPARDELLFPPHRNETAADARPSPTSAASPPRASAPSISNGDLIMSSKVDRHMKRWQDQRWLLDAVIRTIGVEWDQARLAYMAAPAGPEAAMEFRMAGARIRKAADVDREFSRAALRRQARAEAYEAEGRAIAAGESYFIAMLLWASARWPIFEVNDRLVELEERMNHCFEKYIPTAAHPIEIVKVPFQGKEMPAYLHLPRKPEPGERFPCLLSIDGMDASKENMVSMYGDAMLNRGIAVLAIDGPGQGECCTLGIHVTADNHRDAGVAAVDWLRAHPHIDAQGIVVKGVSFGTYFGTLAAAALGDRIRGCAVTGVCQEPGCNTIFNMASPSFKLRFMFMSGYDDEDEFDRFVEDFDLRKHAGGITAPYMVLGGEDDQLSPIEHTYELFEHITAPKKLIVYEGANHGLNEGMSVALGENRNTLMADWFVDRLAGKPMASEKVYVDSTGRAAASAFD
jgi:dienelactone hydrolase